jgi:hypothetical protein
MVEKILSTLIFLRKNTKNTKADERDSLGRIVPANPLFSLVPSGENSVFPFSILKE